MLNPNEIGYLHAQDELQVEWEVDRYSELSNEPDLCYHSPVFAFLDSFWRLKIYPNGETEHQSEDFIGLYLTKEVEEFSIGDLHIELAIRIGRGRECIARFQDDWIEKGSACGSPRFIERSELTKPKFLQSDMLTIECILKANGLHEPLGVPLLERLLNVTRCLKSLLAAGTRSDVIFKVKGQEIKAHRSVLEARSSVFRNMFNDDMAGDRTTVVNIKDTEAAVIQEVLCYVYSGSVENLSSRNAYKIYAAAEKYGLPELKKMCAVFMEGNISDDNVCEIYLMAGKHNLPELKTECEDYMERHMSSDVFFDMLEIISEKNETELQKVSERYFSRNFETILEKDKWKKFEKENLATAFQFLKFALSEDSRRKRMFGGNVFTFGGK